MNIKQAMILSAGEGKRMRPLSDHCPKPLLSLGKKRIIDHVIAMLHDTHIHKISLNIYQHKEKFNHLDNIAKFQENTLLDSGGGINNMLSYMLPDPFFCINGDSFVTAQQPPSKQPSILQLMANMFDMAIMDCLMLLCSPNQVIGDFASGDYDMNIQGQLIRSQDKSGDYFYCGIQIINPVIFNSEHHNGNIFSMRDIWDNLQQNKRLYGFLLTPNATCYHIGTPNALTIAEQHLYG